MLKHFQLIKLENKVHKVQSASPFLIFEFVGEVLSGIKQKTGRDDQRKSSEMAVTRGNLRRWREGGAGAFEVICRKT